MALVTGHEDPAKPESALNWEALAAFPGTLVLYMGVARLQEIAGALIAAGRSADEPAAVVEGGTLPAQRTVRAPLGELAEAVARAGVRAPAVTVVGPVSELAEQIAWREAGPAGGAHRGRHPRAGAGQRHGPAPAGARRARGRGAGDSHPPAR